MKGLDKMVFSFFEEINPDATFLNIIALLLNGNFPNSKVFKFFIFLTNHLQGILNIPFIGIGIH